MADDCIGAGRAPHHAKFEIMLSDFTGKGLVASIVDPATVYEINPFRAHLRDLSAMSGYDTATSENLDNIAAFLMR